MTTHSDGSPQLPSETVQGSWDAIKKDAQEEAATQHGLTCAAELVMMQVYAVADDAGDETLLSLLDPLMNKFETVLRHLECRVKWQG